MLQRESAMPGSQRDLFELPDDLVYLNCASMAPQMRAVTAAGDAAVRQKQAPWAIGERDWFTASEDLRASAAHLMGANPHNVALVPAVSYGIAVAAANVRIARGQNVVLLAEQFPSNVYAWRAAAAAVKAEVRMVRRDPRDDWTAVVLAAIDDDTAVVAVPNYHWTDGTLVDLTSVGARARAVEAALIVDASQSFGASPLSVDSIQPDFLVSVGYKWQLGPYGLGYMYVSPKWCETGRPLEASWLTRARADDFAALVDYVDDYRPGARRFDMGAYPQFVLAPMALAALGQLRLWGIAKVESRIRHITQLIADEAETMDCFVLPARNRAAHFLGIRPRGGIPEGLLERLRSERIYVSVRGDAIRISPHVYSSVADAWRFLDVLREFRGHRSVDNSRRRFLEC